MEILYEIPKANFAWLSIMGILILIIGVVLLFAMFLEEEVVGVFFSTVGVCLGIVFFILGMYLDRQDTLIKIKINENTIINAEKYEIVKKEGLIYTLKVLNDE